jgi:hypothetical protein
MISRLTPRFKKAFEKLPKSVQAQAKTVYQLWQRNPAHRSLRFKPVLAIPNVYAVRIGIGWRALGVLNGDEMSWFWIGSHEEYNKLLKRL